MSFLAAISRRPGCLQGPRGPLAYLALVAVGRWRALVGVVEMTGAEALRQG